MTSPCWILTVQYSGAPYTTLHEGSLVNYFTGPGDADPILWAHQITKEEHTALEDAGIG